VFFVAVVWEAVEQGSKAGGMVQLYAYDVAAIGAPDPET
jgi:hypothetical protein